ncbi:hypothetical protein [Pseudonocardia acaciae]|uniref:hypothetical protein n=1 Tax=Pseudonocardia acaciae TaxID=551276 RepID=UPI000687BA5C|nr:hypothetical protein [Pseudonocardia acaciae]
MTELTRQVRGWHRPMMLLAGAMVVMAVVSAVGLAVDDRVLIGAPAWLKPFKFAVSIAIYCVTWAWMTSLLTTRRRLADRVSHGLVAVLVIEYAVIVGQVVRGRASHYNVATPLDAALWTTMSVSIAALWLGTLVLTGLLFRAPIADLASRWAIRLGGVLSLVGLALGFLMTSPTAGQLRTMRAGGTTDMIGAHSVGVADGGPIMPVTGWSTVGGDLRIPHFVGMHALQALPLLAMLLVALAGRFPRLRDHGVRVRLVAIAAAGYAGLIGLVTWQALRGQALIHPDAVTMGAAAALLGGVAVAAAVVLRGPAGVGGGVAVSAR